MAALDWGDPKAVADWLLALRTQSRDLIGAAADQVAPVATRRLGRAAAREHIEAAAASMDMLFNLAGVP